MKRFVLLITALLLCGIAAAHTINWHVDGNIYQNTTCDSGESITPPTAPYKYGYHFVQWSEYLPIEYLEGTGTQYIDTGKGFDKNKEITFGIKYAFTNISNPDYEYIAGSTNSVYIAKYIPTNKVHLISGPSWYLAQTANPTGIPTTSEYIINSTEFKLINDTGQYVETVRSMYSGNQNFYLWSAGNNNYAHIKIYHWYMKYDEEFVRDMIPVLDKDGVPCMYDRVEKKFYYNKGTGQFIAGPVIGE